MTDLSELERRLSEATATLTRLGSCADIPMYRRRQLLWLAAYLGGEVVSSHQPDREPFVDNYYRRAGVRMRRPREQEAAPSASIIRAIATQEPTNA